MLGQTWKAGPHGARCLGHLVRQIRLAHGHARSQATSLLRHGRRPLWNSKSLAIPTTSRRWQSASIARPGRSGLLLKLAGAGLLIYGMLNFLDRQEQAITSAGQSSDGALNAETFVSMSVTSIERVSPSTCIFQLQSSAPLPASLLEPIASISVCDPSLNIQRPYTVLEHDLEKGTLSILVKRYATGDMSRFIHGKRVGGTLQIRAHAPAYKVQDYTALGIQTVLCIVGGTGIAVALQLAEHLVTNTKETMPKVSIVYASRSKEEQVLLDRLEQLVQQSHGKISFMALDDQKDGAITTSHLSRALGLQQASLFRKAERVDAAATQVLVCGSDGFIAHVAGVKPEQGQGEVGGLLAEMQLIKHVWKL